MKVKWLGHACFLITGEDGVRMVTDPFDDTVGYPLPEVEADIVTISHDHFDHNYTKAVKGDFELINGAGDFCVKEVKIKGIKTYHDEVMGQKRGDNIVFVMEIDRMKVCHLGDLGHLLSQEDIDIIGPVDLLLIPVGGTYTIDAEDAAKVAAQLNPRMVIPMHFKTPVMDFPITDVKPFLKKVGGERVGCSAITVNKSDLGDRMQVKVLEYR